MNIRNPLRVPRDQRRGVLLLVVLSLLVLFLMIGTAFIITAKQSEKAAKVQNVTALRAGSQAAQGQLLDEVVRQLVRDTGNPHSALRTHSLLADMYGHGGFVATIGNVQWAKPLSYPPPIATGEVTTGPAAGMRGGVTGGQLVQFELSPAMAPGGTPAMGINGVAYPLSPVDGAYNGQVLTFISSPPNGANARGVSTRIVDYRMFRLPGENPVRDHWQVTVLAFPLADGSPLDDGSVTNRLLQGLNGSTILVNGRPFSGTGVGLNPNVTAANQPKLNAAEQIPNVTLANGDLPPIALLPNAAFMQPSQVQTPNYFPPGSEDITGRGGPNESYDAVDFQNMFLALLPPEPVESQPLASGTLSGMVIPSFHRPELLNYWRAETLAAGGIPLPVNAALLRRVMLRPNWLDHELFTGSNPEYAESLAAFLANRNDAAAQAAMLGRAIYGPWDVDNDNDGVRDSIWIDAGLPVIEGPLGRPVKPLVAILCVDLDGRGNVNVHGTADLAGQGANKDWLDTATDGVRSSQTPRGVGWGPAEISLEPVLGRDSFANLLRHRDVPVLGTPNGIRHVGRYGENEAPGRLNMLDMLTQVTLHGWPQWGAQVPRSLFASPPDLKARYGVGLNALGQPILEATLASERGSNRGRLTADSPYEARLFGEGATSHSGPDAIDAPFSLAELERVLRAYDLDAQALPRRLSVVAGVFIPDPSDWAPNSPQQRNMITTDSWDVPTPSVAMPPEWAPLLSPLTGMNSITNLPYQRRLPRTPAELLEVRVRHAIWPGDDDRKFPEPLQGDPTNPSSDAGRLRVVMRQILAPELAAGLRLDVNRPLGNGIDDNGNRVVDEPGEELVSASRPAWRQDSSGVAAESLPASFTDAPFTPLDVTYSNDPQPGVIDDFDSLHQRQLLARHLYVNALMMSAPIDFGSNNQPTAAEQAYCRRVAQWAVNAVDFRDADNIMTPFEYDLNPFNGWEPDGDLRTTADHAGPDGQPGTADDTIVWGVERPELLITETLAWHDRRTEDTMAEDAYPPGDQPREFNQIPGQDFEPDYDQVVRPRGALFIELYNPWGPTPGADGMIHDLRVSGGQVYDHGVNLRAVDDATGTSPVWRMAIYKRGTTPIANTELWDPDARATAPAAGGPAAAPTDFIRPNVPMDRCIYFTGFDPEVANGQWDDDGVAFFADPGRPHNVGSVRPGRYLVVGSGDETTPGSGVYASPLGDRLAVGAAAPAPPSRRIELIARATANPGGPRRVRYNDNGNVTFQDPRPTAQYPVETPPANNGVLPELPAVEMHDSVADVAIIDHVYDYADGYDDRPNKQNGNHRRRLTLSEPARGYIDNFANSKWTLSPGGGLEPRYIPPLDIPLDGPLYDGGDILSREDQSRNPAFSADPVFPFPVPEYLRQNMDSPSTITIDPALLRVDAISGANDPRITYAWIYLQRLANPTLPWNPEPGRPGYNPNRQVNPYLTIDGMSANLNVFNGRQQATGTIQASQEEDPFQTVTKNEAQRFASLERGFRPTPLPLAPDKRIPSLWRRQLPSQSSPTSFMQLNHYEGLTAGHVYGQLPYGTLGFLNSAFQRPGPPAADPRYPGDPTGVNVKRLAPHIDPPSPPQNQIPTPFQWITWNDRPYVSGSELMLVPRVRSSQLMHQFSVADNMPGGGPSPYASAVVDKPVGPQGASANYTDTAAYAHLENWLFGDQTPASPPPAGTMLPTRLYRLLDLLGTRSLYAGAKTWLNPTFMRPAAPPASATAATAFDDPRMDLQPPFNSLSSFREPGRVNLNTIIGRDVWRGLFHGNSSPTPGQASSTHPGPEWSDFLSSRRGYPGGNDPMTLNNDWPTLFGNPFRPSGSGDYVPIASMLALGPEATTKRSINVVPNSIGDRPLFSTMTDDLHRDWKQSPFFRYEPMIRLENLTTTRSNVFAVWITIGFFDVEPASDPVVYPDGYQFGRESGLDEGSVTRLRGFYVIDRTQPAGFQPGKDHNTDNVIRLRRRIE